MSRSKFQTDLELAEVKAGAELQLKARLLEASQAELARREVGRGSELQLHIDVNGGTHTVAAA